MSGAEFALRDSLAPAFALQEAAATSFEAAGRVTDTDRHRHKQRVTDVFAALGSGQVGFVKELNGICFGLGICCR